jgi:hypothetical protein
VRSIFLSGETDVAGNVDINGGAPGTRSGVEDASHIGGNARILNNQGTTQVTTSLIDGNLSILRNTGDLAVHSNAVGGNVDIVANTVPASAIISENFIGIPGVGGVVAVGGSLRVYNNTGPGAKDVSLNTAGRVVACRDNTPPFIGGPNVAPKKEGQCF